MIAAAAWKAAHPRLYFPGFVVRGPAWRPGRYRVFVLIVPDAQRWQVLWEPPGGEGEEEQAIKDKAGTARAEKDSGEAAKRSGRVEHEVSPGPSENLDGWASWSPERTLALHGHAGHSTASRRGEGSLDMSTHCRSAALGASGATRRLGPAARGASPLHEKRALS